MRSLTFIIIMIGLVNPYNRRQPEWGVHATSRAKQGADGKDAGTMVLKVIAAPSCPDWTRAVLIMGTALAVASREF